MERLKPRTACSSVDCVYTRYLLQKPLDPRLSRSASHNKYTLRTRLQLGRYSPNIVEYVYCRAAADKQDELDHRNPALPDTSNLRPELQQQWHIDRNKHLGGIKVKPYSQITVAWQCHKCPAGQPHVWTACVDSRTRGSNSCPYCRNRLVCLHNSLATVAPDVAQYWSHSKNTLSPQQVVAGSNLKAEWKCPACNWEWQAPIEGRVHNRSGSPKCSNAVKVTQSQPTLMDAQPRELVEWDSDRNNAEGIYPDTTTLGSHKMVHWVCSCCPRGQPHRWRAPPYSRIGDGRGCPICAGRQACVCNSVESLFPLTAAEWDFGRNDAAGIYPDQITIGSSKLVHWVCSRCPRGQPHRWTAMPNDRIGQGKGCAGCARKQACLCNSLESLFPALAAEFDVDENGFAPSQVTAHSRKKVWWRNAERGSWKQSVAVRTDSCRRQSL